MVPVKQLIELIKNNMKYLSFRLNYRFICVCLISFNIYV